MFQGFFKGGMFWKPRSGENCGNGYQFDLDGSLRYGRPKTGYDYFPYPPISGTISGILPIFNPAVWAGLYAPQPFGPGVGPSPVNLQWQVTINGLSKFDG